MERTAAALPQPSVEAAMETLRALYAFGERAAGTPAERAAAEMLAERMRTIGCDEVRLEEFPVVARHYRRADLVLLSPERRPIAAAWGALSESTGPAPITAGVVDARWGTAADFDRLAERGIEVENKIVLIDRRDDLTMWADIPARQAAARGAAACLLSMRVLEHDALRIDGVAGAPIPVLFIRYNDAQLIRALWRQGAVTASLRQHVDVDHEGVSQNVVGEIRGSERPDEWIVISGHYDSWFGGAIDNANGTAAVIEAGRVLRGARPRRSIRLIAFGSEESGTGDYFYWCAGSAAYVRQHADEIDSVVLNINADAFAFGPVIQLDAGPGVETAVWEAVERLGLSDRFKLTPQASIGTDQWFFARAGVPSVTLGPDMDPYWKLYQTEYDSPEIVDLALFEDGLSLMVELALAFDGGDPPYDLTPAARRTRRAIAASHAMGGLVGVRAMDREMAWIERETPSLPGPIRRRILGELCRALAWSKFDNHYQAAGIIEAQDAFLSAIRRLEHALRAGELEAARAAADSLPTISWGRNVDQEVYDEVLADVRESWRASLWSDEMRAFWETTHQLAADDAAAREMLLRLVVEERRRLVRVAARMIGDSAQFMERARGAR